MDVWYLIERQKNKWRIEKAGWSWDLSQISLEVVDWDGIWDMWWEKVMSTGWRNVWSIELKAEDRLEDQERRG